MIKLKRKIRSNKIDEYKPSLYPSFTVQNKDGINLKIDESNMDKEYSAKIKLTGVNKRTTNKKKLEIEWTFEIQAIDN